MTARMTRVSKFNMPVLRRRAKRVLRQKHKKTIKLSQVDKVWKEWVELYVYKELLKFGKVQIDKNFSIEIVGKRIIDDPKMFKLVVNGLNINRSGKVKEAVKFDYNRNEVAYKIVLEDKSYKKGKMTFVADPKLSRRVHEELKNTKTYYRIA